VETWTAINTVRVVRHFEPRPLEPAHLRRILDAGRRTGSSKNRQDWTFIVVRDRTRLAELSKVGPYAGHLAGATLAIALIALVGPATRDRWDLGRAAQDMILAAWELGIGSVPATVYEPELAARLLGLPEGQECPYLLSFGYPADAAVLTRPNRPGGRKSLAEVVFDEWWGQAWTDTPFDTPVQLPADTPSDDPAATFDAATLARLAEAWEIEIETRAGPAATVHRTVIWVVVEDGQAFIRTVRGPRSRWYREALAHPRVVVLVDGERIAATVVPAADAEWVALCSFGLARKYASDPSLPAMLAPGVLGTTLRVDAA
jgi:nitroreductase